MNTSSQPYGEAPLGPLLTGVRVLESTILAPAELGGVLADLGADVIKIEPPGGDYGRQMTWPMIRLEDDSETSLLSLHVNRGKRSVVIDLREEEGVAAYFRLVRHADVVIEGMRPGALARRGITEERLREENPSIVFCSISGYGASGPYRDMPSHGIAYDAWAGHVHVGRDEHGQPYIPDHTSIGIHAAPAYAALGILAGVLSARTTGRGCSIEIAQSDASLYFDWWTVEALKSYERPFEEVRGSPADGGARRPPGPSGMKESVRYQIYSSLDGFVLLMASEQAFWRNFCLAIERSDLFERWPGAQYGDHARGNKELQGILTTVFATKSTGEWLTLGLEHNVPIAPVNTPSSVTQDAQFGARFSWQPQEIFGAELLPLPLRIDGQPLVGTTPAPTVGQHTVEVLSEIGGYDAAQIAALKTAGVLG